MKHAWRELQYGKKKYILIELLLILLMFMVLFLSGLASGLGRAVSSAIETADAKYFAVDDSAEQIITVSSVDASLLDDLRDAGIAAAPLDIQRMYLMKPGADEKINVTYFAIEPGSFLEPDVIEGAGLGTGEEDRSILLDDDYRAEGIAVGDTVMDSSTDIRFTVSGFVKDQMYGHTSVAFISTDTYTALRKSLNPLYEKKYHAIALETDAGSRMEIDGVEFVSRQDIVQHIPSYSAEHLTITMIVWVLVVVSAVVIGIFFYILALQKRKQYGVMKAIGMRNGELVGIIVSEVSILSVIAAVISLVLTFAMAAAMPEKMPFYLEVPNAILVTVAFVMISILGSLLSAASIARIDPVIAIGGEDE